MKKVFVVIRLCYNANKILGIYDTRPKAEKARDRFTWGIPDDYKNTFIQERDVE